ncbi:MAG: hypothetical protein QW228_03225 [Candidatus Aenigmatarchaeota archaeon]
MKRSINTKAKGDSFERKVAKIFTNWYGKTVRRTPLSGQIAIKSDIISDEDFPFLIECKKHERFYLEEILSSGVNFRKMLLDIEDQKNSLFYKENKIQAIIYSRSRTSIYIILPEREFKKVKTEVRERILKDLNWIMLKFKDMNFYVFLLADFLREIKPSEIGN